MQILHCLSSSISVIFERKLKTETHGLIDNASSTRECRRLPWTTETKDYITSEDNIWKSMPISLTFGVQSSEECPSIPCNAPYAYFGAQIVFGDQRIFRYYLLSHWLLQNLGTLKSGSPLDSSSVKIRERWWNCRSSSLRSRQSKHAIYSDRSQETEQSVINEFQLKITTASVTDLSFSPPLSACNGNSRRT